MSTDIAAELKLLFEVLENSKAVQYVAASMLALNIYDICIFFADEFDFIWRAKWSWGKLLYLCIRFGSLLAAASTVQVSLSIDISPRLSNYYANTSGLVLRNNNVHSKSVPSSVSVFSSLATLIVVQLLRATAVFGESSRNKKILFFCTVLELAAGTALYVALLISFRPVQRQVRGLPCVLSGTFSRPIYLSSYACALAFDTTICVACVIKAYRFWTEGESKLVWIIFRDILAYILIINAMALPQFITPFFLTPADSIVTSAFSYAISGIAGIVSCRMILNMRVYAGGTPNINLSTMAMSYIPTTTVSQMDFENSGDDDVGIPHYELDEIILGEI